jgi:phage/plasmid-associated DNA primase
VPERVLGYTGEYREENDLLADWLASCCELGSDTDVYVFASDLRSSYEQWAEQNGETPVGTSAWGAALRARGCQRDRRGGKRLWRGLALREEGA